MRHQRFTMSGRAGAVIARGISALSGLKSAPVALTACLSLCLALAGCAPGAVQASNVSQAATAQPTPTVSALPPFNDWRVAYLNAASDVSVASVNGQVLQSKLSLPGVSGGPSQQFVNAGVSSDGHTLVYFSPEMNILDLSCRRPPYVATGPALSAVRYFWSPDGSELADPYDSVIINVATRQVIHLASADARPWAVDAVGWLDAGHLAVLTVSDFVQGATARDSVATTATLSSFDIATHAMRPIIAIHSSGLGLPAFAISPDGNEALFSNQQATGEEASGAPFVPMLKLIDTRADAVHTLTSALATTGSGFTAAFWRPGSQQVVVAQQYQNNGKTYLLDVAHDTAAALPLATNESLFGWAPDGSYFVASSFIPDTNPSPVTISALTVSASGQMRVRALSRDAIGMPLGFVRMG